MSRRDEKRAEREDRLAEEQAREVLMAKLSGRPVPRTGPAGPAGKGAESGTKRSAKGSKGRAGGKSAPQPRELFVPPRGWYGPGGGRVGYLDPPTMWRATTVQACGMWPFAAGSGSPMTGVPLGQHLFTGATVCGDPLNWFTRARFISNPSLFMLGMPGLGKSTLVNRMLIGLAATGVVPLVLGDLKPDYADTVRALGGQVISIGRGRGGINVLDPGAMGAAAAKIGGSAGDVLMAEAHGRVLNMVAALITIVRGRPMDDHEQSVLSAALHHLREHTPSGRTVLLPDVLRVLNDGPDRVRSVTLDRGNDTRYRDAVDPLHRSLLGILDGPLGDTFASETSTHIDPDAPAVCVDISGIGEADTQLTAAAMLAAWSDGLGTVAASHALADAGLAPRRWFFTVLDELWRPLRAASGIVDRIDALTRLNRTLGLGDAKITHTLKDAEALGTDADRAKARGFVERAGMVVCAGLPQTEMEELGRVVGMSRREIELVSSWSSPPGWGVSGDHDEPPGRGRFLIKVGGRPGIPIRVAITDAERRLHNTNTRWTTNEAAIERAAARATAEVVRAAESGVRAIPGDGATPASHPDSVRRLPS
ncbi:ATP/GTP-binding protein [Streptomyces sp. ME03-5684b]|uniref:ATP/GTP-binding protein n=1 Tax=Streptomyces sp. ME03-5684b TaxID=3028681 RepID=UPI0029B432A4|nr:ATP/GTP-binding protein [Streptomyces sp. ME03-5684b]MDX3319636.1 ATP/GTP-binding protein [Streptomyces sp. ME03-5684b]